MEPDAEPSVRLVTGRAGRGAVYESQNPQAIHLPEHRKTVVTYRGDDADPFVTVYDHEREDFEQPVRIATNPLSNHDNHGPPSVCVGSDGSLYVFYGAHNSSLQMARSPGVEAAATWTDLGAITGVPLASYPFPAVFDGDLYVCYRTNAPDRGHGETYPAHEYATIITSTDRGETWRDLGPVIDITGHPSAYVDAYVKDGDQYEGGFHLSWCIAHGETHNDTRAHVFHAVFDPATETMRGLDGTDFGSTVTWDDMGGSGDMDGSDSTNGSVLKAFDGQHTTGPKHAFAGEAVYLLFAHRNPDTKRIEWRLATWDGTGDWSVEQVGDATTTHLYNGGSLRIDDAGNPEAHIVTGDGTATALRGAGRGGDFRVYTRIGGDWTRHVVARATDSDSYSRVSTVLGGSDGFASLFAAASDDPEDFEVPVYACGTAWGG